MPRSAGRQDGEPQPGSDDTAVLAKTRLFEQEDAEGDAGQDDARGRITRAAEQCDRGRQQQEER